MRNLKYGMALCALLAVTDSARAGILGIDAGDNPSGPTTVTTFNGTMNSGFSVAANVSYDATAGQWEKDLTNTGGGISSGQNVAISETLVNSGLLPWTDWHEHVISTTTVDGNPNFPEFLFDSTSLSVSRNGVPLTAGTDYTLVTDQVFNRSETVADWSSVSIYFNPASDIPVGGTLQISEQIYEVFGNANIWVNGEAAQIGQNPTVPEPASIVLVCLAAIGLAMTVHWRRHV
jgi:hypothetical protein